jgi:hypothetical protein
MGEWFSSRIYPGSGFPIKGELDSMTDLGQPVRALGVKHVRKDRLHRA